MNFRLWRMLRSWFAPAQRYDIYHPGERLIFHYFDGTKTIAADPMVLHRKIMDQGPELWGDMATATIPNAAAGEAQKEVVAKIRFMFNLKPFEEGGLTEIEAVDLLNAFFTFEGSVKKKSNTLQTSATSTAVSKPLSGDALPTIKPSDSGSIGSAPSTAAPEPSSLESVSPSDSPIPV